MSSRSVSSLHPESAASELSDDRGVTLRTSHPRASKYLRRNKFAVLRESLEVGMDQILHT